MSERERKTEKPKNKQKETNTKTTVDGEGFEEGDPELRSTDSHISRALTCQDWVCCLLFCATGIYWFRLRRHFARQLPICYAQVDKEGFEEGEAGHGMFCFVCFLSLCFFHPL
jgi:hypothetical protein